LLVAATLGVLGAPRALAADAGAVDPLPAALARCQAAYRALAAGKGVFAGSVAVACSDLYREPACARAFRQSVNQPPEALAASIAYACRDAYCPKLAPPTPVLCAANDPLLPSQLPAAWTELNGRILSLELGLPADRTRGFDPGGGAAVVPLVQTAPPEERSTVTRVQLHLLPSGDVELRVPGSLQVWIVDPTAGPTAFSPAAVAAHHLAGATDLRALIEGDRAVPFSAVRTMLQALTAAGFTQVSFSIEDAGPKH
jgi:hypothetical protein